MAVVYFHVDTDGYSSAAIVSLNVQDVYMQPINYGWEIDKSKIKKGEQVFVVDFTFDIDTMKYFKEHHDLVWIDHHEEICLATEAVLGSDTKGIRKYDKAGVELTWEYFHPNKIPPKAVSLIGAYDLWEHDRYPDIVAFQRGLQELDTFPIGIGKVLLWKRIFEDEAFCADIIASGHIVFARERKENAIKCRYMCSVVNFHGYKALIANIPFTDSYMFDSVINPDIHELMIGYYHYTKGENNYWKFSVRVVDTKNSTIDVGHLCKTYYENGGGHPHAAGFSIPKLSMCEALKDIC